MGRSRFEVWGVFGSLGTICLASLAQAGVPSLDFRRLELSTDPSAGLYLEPPATPGHLAWNVGVWGSYAYRLIELEDEAGRVVAVPVAHQISVDYLAAVGLTRHLAFGIVLPTVVYQSGDDARQLVSQAQALPASALGDLRLTLKATLVPSGDLGGFSLAALGRASLPTGDETSYASEGSASGELRLLGEFSLIAVVLRATTGVRMRGAEQKFAGLDVQHELPWGMGLVFRPQILGIDRSGRWAWSVEARGAVSLAPGFAERRESLALLGPSARYAIGDFTLNLGAEFSLTDTAGAPAVRGLFGIGYAPRFPDLDQDGILDEQDECVELAEDVDGFEDSDGCPDFDNDQDGVPDEHDQCPAHPEDQDGFQDEDGCPDPDNDRDGVPDPQDPCPLEPGSTLPGAEPGCPLLDGDADGMIDSQDSCPTEAEDRDQFQDQDGCPDPDNDADGIVDTEDACPLTPGSARSNPALNGCPNPDRDGDTFNDPDDQCPDEAEDFDGTLDSDGCADPGPGTPLARWDLRNGKRHLVLAKAIQFLPNAGVDPDSEVTLRAIAALLNRNPEFVLLVSTRPPGASPAAEQLALNRSFEIAEALRRNTHRDDAAETIGWAAVRKLPQAPGATTGFIVLVPRATP